MNRTIVLDWNKSENLLEKTVKGREFFYAPNQKEAYLNHIEKGGVDSYVINCRDRDLPEIKSLIRHIHYLNAIISIILYKGDRGSLTSLAKGENIYWASEPGEIGRLLAKPDHGERAFNRIQWPLSAQYWTEETSSLKRPEAMVTSISSGGCFFKAEKGFSGQKGERISLLFHFRNFDFLSDGDIVRIDRKDDGDTDGIAIKFIDVTPQTEKYIQEIINEKILSEIMQMIK